MQQNITPYRIANSILQDTSYTGAHLLVEGESDIKLYRKFINKDGGRIIPCFGKDKMVDAYTILLDHSSNRVVGIRDADFLRINGNYSEEYDGSIFITDCHDSEGMIFSSEAFTCFLSEVVNDNVIKAFIDECGCMKTFIYELAYPLGCLRLANKMHNLGLSFKPATPEGNTLKFKKFICDKTATYLGHDKLINTVVEYSKNRGAVISARKDIEARLIDVINLRLPFEEISNGHDLSEIIYLLCKKRLKSRHQDLNNAASVESMLRLTFGQLEFIKTKLYSMLLDWQKKVGCNLLLVQETQDV